MQKPKKAKMPKVKVTLRDASTMPVSFPKAKTGKTRPPREASSMPGNDGKLHKGKKKNMMV